MAIYITIQGKILKYQYVYFDIETVGSPLVIRNV